MKIPKVWGNYVRLGTRIERVDQVIKSRERRGGREGKYDEGGVKFLRGGAMQSQRFEEEEELQGRARKKVERDVRRRRPTCLVEKRRRRRNEDDDSSVDNSLTSPVESLDAGGGRAPNPVRAFFLIRRPHHSPLKLMLYDYSTTTIDIEESSSLSILDILRWQLDSC